MFIKFQRIALDVSYGFERNRSMFLIVVFLMKKRVYVKTAKKKLANFIETCSKAVM